MVQGHIYSIYIYVSSTLKNEFITVAKLLGLIWIAVNQVCHQNSTEESIDFNIIIITSKQISTCKVSLCLHLDKQYGFEDCSFRVKEVMYHRSGGAV